MKTTTDHLSKLLLLSAFLLACAGSAWARNIPVEWVTINWSEINPTPTAGDTITIKNNGVLNLDAGGAGFPNYTCGQITIGDPFSAGTLRFGDSALTLSVSDSGGQSGSVLFGGGSFGNLLDISYLSVTHTIAVAGQFLPSGAGTFRAGAGKVVYNKNGPQTVTAKIGTDTIQYKDLTLTGAGAGNVKTLANGVTVQGTLVVEGTSIIAGSTSVTYGVNGALVYNGPARTTTDLEFPPWLPVSATFNAPITLNGDKTVVSFVRMGPASTLNDNGKVLTVQGDVLNYGGGHTGAGKIVLAGYVAQNLYGGGTYGNVEVKNAAGVTPNSNLTFFTGRLTITTGKLTLMTGMVHTAAYLTAGGVDQPVWPPPPPPWKTFGYPGSGADVTNPDWFAANHLGLLRVLPKPIPSFTNLVPGIPGPVITYGDTSVTISGKVTGGANGNTAQNNPPSVETVTVKIDPATPGEKTATAPISGGDGSFTVTFSTVGLPWSPAPHPITFAYSGGINLAPTRPIDSPTPYGLTVNKRLVIVTPINKGKVYGTPDPPLTYTVSGPKLPPVVPPDDFTGALARDLSGGTPGVGPGEQVGGYAINIGSLALSTNYELHFNTGFALTIIQRPLVVTARAATKVYGNPDPLPFVYDVTAGVPPVLDPPAPPLTPPVLPPDTALTGVLSRVGGNPVGQYDITIGSLAATGNYVIQTYTKNLLTITQRPITVLAPPWSKIYDNVPSNPTRAQLTTAATKPALSYADTYSGQLNRLPGENVVDSPRRIVQDNFTAGPNYLLTFVENDLTITPKSCRVLAVTSPDPSKTYGPDALPTLVIYPDLVPPQTLPVTKQADLTWQATTPPGLPTPPTFASVPGSYPYTIVANSALDSNYAFVYPAPQSSVLTINPRILYITAKNETKIADGTRFNPRAFSVTYDQFVFSDSENGAPPNNAFLPGGLLAFVDNIPKNAVEATEPGVYIIRPYGLTSTKYTIIWVDGTLTITGPVGTTPVAGPVTWGPGGSFDWEINQANGGTAGATPGWSLLDINPGGLNITATAANKFKIHLTTLNPYVFVNPPGAYTGAGQMAKFDPTRPYSWKIVQTFGGITGFAPGVFDVVSDGAYDTTIGLFANKVFDGTFSVRSDGMNLYVDFSPAGGYSSATRAALLAHLSTPRTESPTTGSDVSVLYLMANKSPITPQEQVTVSLNVANLVVPSPPGQALQQPITTVQGYLAYSSYHFSGTPIVEPAGGVWERLILATWQADPIPGLEDLDMVIGVKLQVPALSTTANAAVANIRLTPNSTYTGPSRVVFRTDAGAKITSLGTVDVPSQQVLPGRVPTDSIMITDDTLGPVFDDIFATQVQPPEVGLPIPVTVSGALSATPPPPALPTPPAPTVRGTVNFTVKVKDVPGVGLAGAPSVTLTPPAGPSFGATPVVPNDGYNFQYTWPVNSLTLNGRWTVTVVATDRHAPVANSTTRYFALDVNKNQVTGVVELEGFVPPTTPAAPRVVTFKAGDLNGTPGSVFKQWNISLNFTAYNMLPAGVFRDAYGFANQLGTPTQSVSEWLRYGSINNLQTLVNQLLGGTRNMDAYMRDKLFGHINDITWPVPPGPVGAVRGALANVLITPVRSVDVYIQGRLSASTIAALNAYAASPTSANLTVANNAILADFARFVAGSSIYEPVRFASVNEEADPRINPAWLVTPPTNPQDLIRFNRYLLEDTYFLRSLSGLADYVSGQLNGATANGLLSYTGGSNPTLVSNLLRDFDRMTTDSTLWPVPPPPNSSLYNETVFLGITLQPDTLQAYYAVYPAFPPGPALTLLNRRLMRDAYTPYVLAPLSTSTVATLYAYLGPPVGPFAPLEQALLTDLNALINGPSIYNQERWAAFENNFTQELVNLLPPNPAPTGDSLKRQNLLLLRAAFNTQLTKDLLATYTLAAVPENTLELSAKTAWNLRIRVGGLVVNGANPDATVNFVNDGTPGFVAGTDRYLQAGDLDGSNLIQTGDYNVLRANWNATGVNNPADINGDTQVTNPDYSLMQSNWFMTGDAEVQ